MGKKKQREQESVYREKRWLRRRLSTTESEHKQTMKIHKHSKEPLGAAQLLSESLSHTCQGGEAGSWRSRPKYSGILTAAFLIEGNSMMLD